MSQSGLTTYSVSDTYQWKFLVNLLKPAHWDRWIKQKHVTPIEFGFIVSGYQPIPNEFLFKIVEDLQTILHHIDRKASFEESHRLDKTFIPTIKELFPHIKKEEDAKEKIFAQAQSLFDHLEIIHRGMMAMPEEYQTCFSHEQGTFKEKLWRVDFLIHWAKTNLGLSLPKEICMLDNNFNIQKELNTHFGKSISQKFNSSELTIEGWFNLNNCRAPKLKALIEAYIKEEELCNHNPNRTFSTGHIQKYLKTDFEVTGLKGDKDNFLKNLSHVASIAPKGASLKKKDS